MQPSAPYGPRGLEPPPEVWIQAERIIRVSRVVSDLGRAEAFYNSALGFQTVSRGPIDPRQLSALGADRIRAHEVVMRIGHEEIALVQFTPQGRLVPLDSRSNDLWFQHLAILVSDIHAAHECLSSNRDWHPITSGGPQTLPEGGVQAFKFRDPDGHPLELLRLPGHEGRRDSNVPSAAPEPLSPFLGIDHSAIAVSSTRRSVAFYRSLGMRPSNRSLNLGAAQARLDGLRSARVKVTGLRPASTDGPGLELLAYQPPGRAAQDPHITDLSCDWVTLTAISASAAPPGEEAATGTAEPRLVIDPDGHRLLMIEAVGVR